MKNKKVKLITFFLVLICHIVKGQSNIIDLKKYVVFTFEVTKKGTKLKKKYYWIIQQDSIRKKNAFEVSPLYSEEYSKDILDRCKKQNRVDMFSASTATNYNFDDDYKLQIKNLLSLISINKVKVQHYKKKWTQNGDSIDVSVYASPIIGVFCNCLQSNGNVTNGFKGIVFLPVSSFSYDSSFWIGENEKIVKYVDYSYVEYSSHYPSYIHGNSNIRVKGSIMTF